MARSLLDDDAAALRQQVALAEHHPVDAVEGGSSVDLGDPPSAPQQDWVVKVTRAGSTSQAK